MTIAAIALILFVASLIRSTFGFGEALIAVPLLSFFMPVEQAAPIAVLASVAVAAITLLQDWHHVHLDGAIRLILPTLAGIPIGLWLLTHAPELWVKTALGLLIAAFSTFVLANRRQQQLDSDDRAWIFGFFAGILGGAYGMNGPPLVIYGALRRWSPQQFRATLQAYFFIASGSGMAGYGLSGLWTSQTNANFAWSLPGLIIATLIGRTLNRRIDPSRFTRWLHIGLITTGLVLCLQAWWMRT